MEDDIFLKYEMGLGFEEPGGRPHQEFPEVFPRSQHPRHPTINGGLNGRHTLYKDLRLLKTLKENALLLLVVLTFRFFLTLTGSHLLRRRRRRFLIESLAALCVRGRSVHVPGARNSKKRMVGVSVPNLRHLEKSQ